MAGCTTPLHLCEPHPDQPSRRLVSSPFDSFDGGKRYVVPCGNCLSCRLNRAAERAVRGVHEARLHESNLFLTLTYDRDHMPCDGSVSVRDHQLFLKRLRWECGPFRYDGCAEYGSQQMRAHLHYIAYGLALPDMVPFKRTPKGEILYESPTLNSVWGKGFAMIGAVNLASIGYVNRYTTKKVLDAEHPADVLYANSITGELAPLKPEFRQSSRNPGIGIPYFEKYRSDFERGGFDVVEGRKVPIPQAYFRHLDADQHRRIKVESAERAERKYLSELERGLPDERSTQRLMTRHESAMLRGKRLIRSLDAEL